MECPSENRDDLFERYLTDRLSADEQEELEVHLLQCRTCFEELCLLQIIQQELRTRPTQEETRKRRRFPLLVPRWSAMVILLAVAIALIVVFRLYPASDQSSHPVRRSEAPSSGPGEFSGATVAHPDKAAISPPAASPSTGSAAETQLMELARINPPHYTPITLRGATDPAQQLFRNAMVHYQAGHYAAAVPGLKEAAAKDPAAANIQFFLGASCLLSGQTDEAIIRLDQVIGMGSTPFLEESRLLLAKIFIHRRDPAAARDQLESVIEMNGDYVELARRLRDKTIKFFNLQSPAENPRGE